MKKKTFIFFILSSLFIMHLHADEVETMKQNYIRAVLAEESNLVKILTSLPKETVVGDQVVTELNQYYSVSNEELNKLIADQQTDGSWLDIDYASLIGTELIKHPERVSLLCKQYFSPKSSFYHSPKLAAAINKAIDFWFKNKFEAVEKTKRGAVQRNWWYNDIGIPKSFATSFILFEGQMTLSQKANAIEVMQVSKIGTTGQNKVWLSGNVLVRGLLENNIELVKQARDTIVSEIIYGASGPRGEGIQYDYSYQQHGRQQQFGNYGAVYLAEMSFWNKVVDNTSLRFDQDKLDILSMLLSEGFQRILWKGYMDVNGLGRQFFKQSQVHKALHVAFSANAFANVDIKNKNKYNSLIEDNYAPGSDSPHLQGLYHFWNSDQTIYRHPQWMASIRMSSLRTLGGEAGNGDNKQGYYMSDGSTYIYVDGDEYNDIFPVWDWRKLPGITAYQVDKPLKYLTFAGYRSQSNFVGNVTDGQTGMTVMHLVRDKLSAFKSWIFTDNYVLCLGTGITTANDSVVTTSIDQLIKKSGLLHFNQSKWTDTKDIELINTKDARFFHHKTGYIVLDGSKLRATNESRTASWNNVMEIYPKEMTETKDVVSLWIDHGSKPQNASYQYLILPASTSQKVAAFNLKDIDVITNTPEVQIVHLPKEKVIFVSTLSSSDFKLPLNMNLKCKQPGLYQIKYKSNKSQPEVIYNDPTQLLEFAEYEINGNHKRIELSKL